MVSPHHGRGMDRSSWWFDLRWAKTTYLRAQVGARGKLFSLATVQATTACGAIQVIEQLNTAKGSGASHSCGEPPDELPITMDPNWVSRKNRRVLSGTRQLRPGAGALDTRSQGRAEFSGPRPADSQNGTEAAVLPRILPQKLCYVMGINPSKICGHAPQLKLKSQNRCV